MGKRENIIVLIFGALFLLSLILLLNQGVKTTGYATTATTTSNVTISVYFAIAMSQNLSQGIQFGTVSTLPTANQNATHNYDGVNTTPQNTTWANGTNGTSMWMNVSTDSNTAVDFCTKADAALTSSGGSTIGVGNESYQNSSQTNRTIPNELFEVGYTTSYVKAGFNTSAGSNNYYRFWLDVPAGTVSGSYNNTISFEGVSTGGGC
ncbi:hypothetical protein HY212_06605 [Candidatus Pacearchaeota archaeon]|nr:hypothetical protein [Candidatus Pacearchaeota archaeon]